MPEYRESLQDTVSYQVETQEPGETGDIADGITDLIRSYTCYYHARLTGVVDAWYSFYLTVSKRFITREIQLPTQCADTSEVH